MAQSPFPLLGRMEGKEVAVRFRCRQTGAAVWVTLKRASAASVCVSGASHRQHHLKNTDPSLYASPRPLFPPLLLTTTQHRTCNIVGALRKCLSLE